MNILKAVLLSGSVLFTLSSCTQKPAKNDKPAATEQPAAMKLAVDGSYATPDYEKRNEGFDWVGITVQHINDNKISIKIRSRADKKKPTCTMDTQADKVKEGIYHAVLQGKNVVFTFNETSVTINTENPQDNDMLHFYCSGGASIAGSYNKIAAALDSAQVDK
jgi:hypothetical protein